MTEHPETPGTIAPLKNVALLSELMVRVINREQNLPGLATFYGPSGYGKSCAAIWNANKYDAIQIQVKSVWAPKSFCAAILHDMGLPTRGTLADQVDRIAENLVITDRPLIIDEADYLVSKRMIELVRDIYESAQTPVILVGEEMLPQKLQQWERVHGRMLDWVAAEPGGVGDVIHLAKQFCRGVELSDDVVAKIAELCHGAIRRIAINLDNVRKYAVVRGLTEMSLDDLGSVTFFMGEAPSPRMIDHAIRSRAPK